MKALLQTLLLVAVIFALAVAVDQIAPLKRFTLYLSQHPEPYRSMAIGMSVAGWVLLIGVLGFLLIARGRPMSEAEARDFMQSSAGGPRLTRVLRGRAAGREFQIAASFREIKDAFRTGAWLREPGWWPLVIGLLAMPLIFYGMFGYFIVIGPPLVKLICAGALVYATLRTLWAFWKA
jgi:hypothetical protein